MREYSGPRTQLWKEEYEILSGLAASVADGGTIVEIGTAEGGTALLFHQATKGRRVGIYTVDIAPSPKAFENLRDSGVTIITQPSEEYAENWKQDIDRSIDFLFIDGNHDLEHLIADWNLWTPFMKPGGLVAIHDYDPPERGGIAHLAVRVGVEAIWRAGFLNNPTHRYKLACGAVQAPDRVFASAEACYDTLATIGKNIVRIRDADYGGACVVADDRLALLLRGCLQARSGLAVVSPEQANDPKRKYLVGAQANGASLEALRERGILDANTITLDNLTICYLIAAALRSNYAYLSEHTSSLPEFLIWVEGLAMFEHAFGESLFPDRVPGPSDGSDIHELSRLIAREQVRLVMLARLLRTFVDWIP